MLRIEGLSLSLGEFRCSGLDFSVGAGEYCIILGPTGAGKTILLETIAGIYRPDSGRIFLEGRDVTEERAELRGSGMVYQDSMLFPPLTVAGDMGFGMRERGVGEVARRGGAWECSAMVGACSAAAAAFAG